MSSDDNMLARLHCRRNGVKPQGQESVYCGLQGLCQGDVLRLVVSIAPITAWVAGVVLAPFQLCIQMHTHTLKIIALLASLASQAWPHGLVHTLKM